MKDALGDRMKGYEREWVPAGRCMPLIPVIVRLDGKNFSRWTRPLKKPFDDRIAAAMTVVTKALVQETNALVGFTQSDEMTLVLYSSDARSSVYFDGKAQKIVSVLAAFATARFNAEAGHLRDEAALFDCRIWQVPNLLEAANAVLWRELDAIKNSIQALGQSCFSHRQLQGKNGGEIVQMLQSQGVEWDNLPTRLQRGAYVMRRKVVKELGPEVLAKIPAGKRPDGPIERHEIAEIELPALLTMTAEKRVESLFGTQ